MNSERVTCPYCWQSIDVEAPGFEEQPVTLTTDCEVCCRPMMITYSWDSPNDAPFVEVDPENE